MILFCVGRIVSSGVGRREGNLWGRGGSWGIVWGRGSAGHLASGVLSVGIFMLSLCEYAV